MECLKNMRAFETIIAAMKDGQDGSADFLRTGFDGNEERVLYMGYPVEVKSYGAIGSSDFGRGVKVTSHLIYPVALAEDILEPFNLIEQTTETQMRVATIVLCVLLAFSTFIVAYISHQVAISISVPMVYLLDLLRLINA